MKTEYSLDKLHEKKNIFERNNGKSVTAIMNVIGSVMATESSVVPFVIQELHWETHLSKMFYDICVNHFNVVPLRKQKYIWGIDGYSTVVKLISWQDVKDNEDKLYFKLRGERAVSPIYDLQYNYRQNENRSKLRK